MAARYDVSRLTLELNRLELELSLTSSNTEP